MKSFAFVALLGVSTAYTIDLCPDAIGAQSLGEAIYYPGNEEALTLGNIWRQRGVGLKQKFTLLSAQDKL